MTIRSQAKSSNAQWNQGLPYFPYEELCCPCCKHVALDIRFASMLPALRQAWNSPLQANSVCRCDNHNKRLNNGKGGHPNSMHLIVNPKWPTTGAAAIDIQWRNWPTKEKLRLARLAHSMGWRVGLHVGFIHLDIGRLLGISPKPFLYGEWDNQFSPDDVL